VGENIALANNATPWNCRMSLLQVLRNAAGCFSNDQNLPLHSISQHFVRGEMNKLDILSELYDFAAPTKFCYPVSWNLRFRFVTANGST